MANWSVIGSKVRNILEEVFDGIASIPITFVSEVGDRYSLRGIVAEPTNNYQKELLRIDSAGILDTDIQRVLFKTLDLETIVGSAFSPAGYLLIDSTEERFDFATTQPFRAVNYTPWISAEKTYTICFVRRAIELADTVAQKSTGDAFQFGSWSAT
jgi:hypothetical protein